MFEQYYKSHYYLYTITQTEAAFNDTEDTLISESSNIFL